MSSEVERFQGGEVVLSRPSRGYPRPGFFTQAGQLDRQRESEHSERMRQLYRDAEFNLAKSDKKLAEFLKDLENLTRANIEAKFDANKIHRTSKLLDEDDPELRARFGVLDDDWFGLLRLLLDDLGIVNGSPS